MPQTARRLPEVETAETPRSEALWTGELHGEVGAMHRAIEERLLNSADLMAVVTLPPRQSEALAGKVSRLTGWAALGVGFAGALALTLRLVI